MLHRYFVYIPDRTRVDPKEAGLQGVEEIVFKAADGTKLIAWYRSARGAKPTLLYFTGNSGNVASRAGKIKTIAADGYGVFMLNYRLYGGSEGRPTEALIAADAVSAYDCLRGQGVAAARYCRLWRVRSGLLSRRDCHSSARSRRSCSKRRSPRPSMLGRLMWKGFPLSLIMVDQYRTIDRIGDVTVPLFMIHGGRDSIIPLYLARRVFHAANEPKSLVVVPQAGHNDLFDRGVFERYAAFSSSPAGQDRQGGPPRGTRCCGERRGPLTATPID